MSNPTLILRDLYRKFGAKDNIDHFPKSVSDHFQFIFNTQNDIDKIPTLDLQNPPESFENSSLVTFNAMVQDTSLSPELYLARLGDQDCGGWGITQPEDQAAQNETDHANLRECSIFWAVSIPGQTAWTFKGSVATHATHQPPQPHKYPIPNASHIGVQLKIYDDQQAQRLRVTDLVSFVGILAMEPSVFLLRSINRSTDSLLSSLYSSIELPLPVIVPTLHVLFSNSLPTTILPRTFPSQDHASSIVTIREELIQWIARESLAGDELVAEWVLLVCIARVRSRHPPVLPPSLTISKFPSPSDDPTMTPALYHILSLILPIISTIPLSLENVNAGSFCPESRDEDLHSGYLQHPKGTVLLFTEGATNEGGIGNKGVLNLRSAQDMVHNQTLEYIFPFSGFTFETEVNFLVTTEGKQSTFFKESPHLDSTDLNITLETPASDKARRDLYKSRDVVAVPSTEKLQQFRDLIGGSKVGNTTLDEATSQYIEEDFVTERRNAAHPNTNGHTSQFTPDDLIQRMLVVRLLALSFHQTQVTIGDWKKPKFSRPPQEDATVSRVLMVCSKRQQSLVSWVY